MGQWEDLMDFWIMQMKEDILGQEDPGLRFLNVGFMRPCGLIWHE